MSILSLRAALNLHGVVSISRELLGPLVVSEPFSLLTAMGAKSVTAIIDSKGHPSAEPYYKTFPYEPVLPTGRMRVASIVEVPDMTVLSLLKAILDQDRENVLIVCHGTSAKLSLPLSESTEIELRGFNAELLADWAEGRQGEAIMKKFIKPAGAWEKWTSTGKLTEQQQLMARIKAVRRRNLDRVELRSCNTGSNEKTLDGLLRFFKCRLLTAPTILDGFAQIDFGTPTTRKETWGDFRRQHRLRIDENGYAIAGRVNISALRLRFFALARSASAIQRFADDHILGAKGKTLGSQFPGHALVGGGSVPIFTADSAYRTHLKMVDNT